MNVRHASPSKSLPILLIAFALASLAHFIHNAEFLADYPGLPDSWTRAGVYGAWLAITAIGIVGWFMERAGYQIAGLVFIALYATTGMDSLGHYVIASFSAHTHAMNFTILLEVTAAVLLFCESIRLIVRRIRTTVVRN